MKRRTFLASATAAVATPVFAQTSAVKRRVAIIGRTGRGNYGHGLDKVWLELPDTQICAVADANEQGLVKTLNKLQIENGYADYRKMLSQVRPEFVTVSPRHPDQHRDMVLAAIESGVKGLYVEKPFCRTPAEADEIIAASTQHETKIAVAHRNRYHPTLKQIDRLLEADAIGQMLELRGRGLGDRRGGGEDLWVLGGHIMNLMHYFAGAPKSCSAIMLQDGRPITGDDVIEGAEGLGPLAANEVHARYEMSSGLIAYYDSIANDDTERSGYCLQLIGSKGTITIHIDRDPVAHLSPGNPFKPTAEPRPWIPITTGGPGIEEPQPELVKLVHNHVLGIRDLIDACDNSRKPLCDARDGAITVEMTCGVFESHRQGGKAVAIPLQQRGNALAQMKSQS
jgi:predicted dehydrogenase